MLGFKAEKWVCAVDGTRDQMARFTKLALGTVGPIFALSLIVVASFFSSTPSFAGVVEVKNNILHIDRQPQPQLFGAEVQYFRLRAGNERNIPREKVMALWNKALDHYVAIGANSISFYIPWDFHEYAPGKFDFDGTADDDGDGRPDFPSRDVKTWFRMVADRGIQNILVRPGPYINAEWGFLGFGAVPLWFHRLYPNSHMRNSKGQATTLYAYNDPHFLHFSKRWLTEVYHQVLKPYIGPGKPISFLQIDNETNFMWQSIFNHDYGPRSVMQYRQFLLERYGSLEKINAVHGREWQSLDDIKAPTSPKNNIAEGQDWYRFQDEVMHTYLRELRRMWEDLGVKEPQVLFTLAESFNAADNGILPNYKTKNDPGQTGIMTVNLYPKTADGSDNPLLNQPFKADHDVKACDAANDLYFGSKQEWVMGPEIQGGWWRGTTVSLESRRQTYLTTIGHGLKSLFVYYFNEGNNWQTDWIAKEAKPFFDELRKDQRYKNVAEAELPDDFWNELNQTFANNVIAGYDLRWVMKNGTQPVNLYFDAALDENANPRPSHQLLKDIGTKIVKPYGKFLSAATEVTDSVCFIRDVASNVPSRIPGVDSLTMNSDWAGGLIAYLLHAGINPKIVHWDLGGETHPEAEIASCQVLVYQDNGLSSTGLIGATIKHVASGKTLINFLGNRLTQSVLANKDGFQCENLPANSFELEGTKCLLASGGKIYQIRTPIHKDFNSSSYAIMTDVPARRDFLSSMLNAAGVQGQVNVVNADRVVAFARTVAGKPYLYVTVKSGRKDGVLSHIQWRAADPKKTYVVRRLLEGSQATYSGQELIEKGFIANLGPHDSDAFFVQAK